MNQASRILLAALVLAIALMGVGLGVAVAPARTAFSWLVAFSLTFSLGGGALGLWLVTLVVRGPEAASFRRLLGGLAMLSVALGVLYLPVVPALDEAHLWAGPRSSLDPVELAQLERLLPWLSPGSFYSRSLLYLASLAALPLLLVWTRAGQLGLARTLSAPAWVLFAAIGAFASVDWMMAIAPLRISSLYGAYVLVGGTAAATGACAVLAPMAVRAGALPVTALRASPALGKAMLTLTCLWGWIGALQILLLSSTGPGPETFYEARVAGRWGWVAAGLVGLRFVVPFSSLLSARTRARPRALAGIGGLMVAGHVLDVAWLILPFYEVHHGPVLYGWLLDACAVSAMGVFGAVLVWLAVLHLPAPRPAPEAA